MPRITAFDVPAQYLIEEMAKDMKENLKLKEPEFTIFVKTGSHKERPPQQKDWWYIRCASILRRLYIDGPHGVERLRTYYGGRKHRGTEPEIFRKAGGKIIRSCLQALESLGFLEKVPKGRKVSPKGESYLTKFSALVHKKLPEYKKLAEERKLQRLKRLKEAEKEREKLKETMLSIKGTTKRKKAKKQKEKSKAKEKKKKK